MRSLQGRLTLYTAGGAAILLVAGGIVVDRLVRASLDAEFDRNLLAKAMTLVALTEQDAGRVEFDFVERVMHEYGVSERAEYFELWLPDATPLAKSPSLAATDLPRPGATEMRPSFRNLLLPGGRRVRVVSFAFVPEQDAVELAGPDGAPPDTAKARETRVGIAVARGTEDLAALLSSVRWSLGAVCAVLLGMLAFVVRAAVRRGLAPLRQVAGEVRALDPARLDARIGAVASHEELAPVIHQLNALLERLDAAFQRERRFSGNVAHELRTPIAELRTMAEVGRNWPADADLVRAFFGDLVNLADDMERTVANLLMLARLDAGQQGVDTGVVDLEGLIERSWRPFAAEAEQRRVVIENRIGEGVRVMTDGDKLALILANLFSNAVHHCPPGSVVVAEARGEDDRAQVVVTNPASDLTADDLPLLFERFWRKDAARSARRHAGLGLSLVQALAKVLGLEVRPALSADGRFTMTVSGLRVARYDSPSTARV